MQKKTVKDTKQSVVISIAIVVVGTMLIGWSFLPSPNSQQSSAPTDESAQSTSESTAIPTNDKTFAFPKIVDSKYGEQPNISFDSQATPPTKLKTKVIKKGTGKEIKKGNNISVNYSGVVWGNITPFDSSFTKGTPFETKIPGSVIDGWNEGLIGQKQGSRVMLVIPPDKGYGDQAQENIPANSTLVFVIDIVKVT
jgi:peptidylprolyl isomerase